MHNVIELINAGDTVINLLKCGHIKTAQVPIAIMPMPISPAQLDEATSQDKSDKKKGKSSFASSALKIAAILAAIYAGAALLKRFGGLPSARISYPAGADPQENLRNLLSNPYTAYPTMLDMLEGKLPSPTRGFSLHLNPEKIVL